MISLKEVSKNYGKTKVFTNMDLTISQDKIYCLIGRNGAGKTTLMQLIAGKCEPSKGNVLVDNKIVNTFDRTQKVTFLEPGKKLFNIKLNELIHFYSSTRDHYDIDLAREMLTQFELDGNKKYNQLSFGMKTMVSNVLALADVNDVVLLDEPTLGFDPVIRQRFYQMVLKSYEKYPRIIIISTNQVDEVYTISDHVIMLHNGQFLLNEESSDISEKAYVITGLTEAVQKATEGLRILYQEEYDKYCKCYIFDQRVHILEDVEVMDATLQDIFISIVGGCGNEGIQ